MIDKITDHAKLWSICFAMLILNDTNGLVLYNENIY